MACSQSFLIFDPPPLRAGAEDDEGAGDGLLGRLTVPPLERDDPPDEPLDARDGALGRDDEESRGAAIRPRLSPLRCELESRFGTIRAPPIRSITCRGIGVASRPADSVRLELPCSRAP